MRLLASCYFITTFVLQSCTSQRFLNYDAVNDHQMSIVNVYFLDDSSIQVGRGLHMAFDSSNWNDSSLRVRISVPTYRIVRVTFKADPVTIARSVAIGIGALAFGGLGTRDPIVAVLSFAAGYFISATSARDVSFSFYPQPFGKTSPMVNEQQ